ncbi:hypothetical protein PIN17_A1193 [Prevotella intermedia 17]|nr:hypothetical protein PIN17_A1193 [Prevotella intermedia 17]
MSITPEKMYSCIFFFLSLPPLKSSSIFILAYKYSSVKAKKVSMIL